MNRLAIIRDLRQYQWRIKMKYWEIIADRFSKAGFNVGWVSALDDHGRTVWIVDAHCDGKRFVLRADEKLTAFVGIGRDDSRAVAVARPTAKVL